MRLLIAVDGSAEAGRILRFCAQLILSVRGAFTILTVIERAKDRERAHKNLALAREILGLESVSLHAKVREGHPAEEIIREAEEFNYDLVIVGEGKHRNLATRFLLGSTSLRVVEHSPCAVMNES